MSGWDCFDDSDNDDDQPGEVTTTNSITLLEAASQQAFLEVVKFCGACNREDEIGEFGSIAVDAAPRIALVECSTSPSALKPLESRLRDANYGISMDSTVLCDICLNMSNFANVEEGSRCDYRGLRAGGLLVLLVAGEDDTVDLEALGLDEKRWALESARTVALTSATKGSLCSVTKRSILLNEQGVTWKPSTPKLLAQERRNAERIAVGRTCASIEHGSLRARDIARAAAVLKEHGVCIIPQLFDPESCHAWGRVAIRDLQHAIQKLATTEKIHSSGHAYSANSTEGALGKDSISAATAVPEVDESTLVDAVLGDEGLRHNYHELAMREAYRVDLRKAPRMARHDTQQASDAEARSKALHVGAPKVNPLPPPLNPRHAGVHAVLQAVMNPPPPEADCPVPAKGTPRPHSSGNFGRWNFSEGENTGPNAAVPLNVSPVGCVMSLPGSGDQALHADVYHLFEDAHLPPHYLNLFFPALEYPRYADDGEQDASKGGGASVAAQGSAIGQTAFVVGSHRMATCARVMADQSGHSSAALSGDSGEVGNGQSEGEGSEGAALDRIKDAGRAERLLRLVRPHLEAGDLVMFDCRVLHFGLANRSARSSKAAAASKAAPAATPAVWRPLLYANVTQRWFEDKKNWEKAALFTAEDIKTIEEGT